MGNVIVGCQFNKICFLDINFEENWESDPIHKWAKIAKKTYGIQNCIFAIFEG